MDQRSEPSDVVRAVVIGIDGGDVLARVPRTALPPTVTEGTTFEMVVTSVGPVAPYPHLRLTVIDEDAGVVCQVENPGRLCD